MKTIFVLVLGCIFLAGLLLFMKDYYVERKLRKLLSRKFGVLKPLIEKFKTQSTVNKTDLMNLLQDPSLRLAVFRILEAYKKTELFPQEYFTHEKGAETFLVNWLEYPTELGAAPDAIELLTKVTIDEDEYLDYYVFQFSSNAPLWASHQWMMGTCGPYRKQSLPYDTPSRIFSRFSAPGSISPEREVQWVHENIKTRPI